MAHEERGGGVRRSRPENASAADAFDSKRRADELIRQGQDLLVRSRIAAAQKKFREALKLCTSSVRARSRLALTHWLQGEADRAESEVHAVLAVAPDDVLALTTLAQVQAAQRRWPEAQATVEQALKNFYAAYAAGAAEPEHLANAARMLAAMDDDRRLYQLYRRCVRGVPGRWDATALTHMGLAAFNLGRWTEARWLWRMAAASGTGELDDVLDSFVFVLDKVEQGQVPPFAINHRLRDDAVAPGDQEPPGLWKVFSLRALWDSDDLDNQEIALHLLAEMDEPWASDMMFHVVRQPDLPDELKMKAAVWLLDQGLIEEGEPLEMHVDGRLQPVVIDRDDVYPAERGGRLFYGVYEPDLEDLLDEALIAQDRGDAEAAEAVYREMLALDPDHVPALVGLAGLCRASGREPEAERLLGRALALELALQLDDEAGDDAGPPDQAAPAGRARTGRAVDPSWSWDEALQTRTLATLRDMAGRLGVKNRWAMRKAPLAAAVAARLRARLRWVWQGLGDAEQAALLWLHQQGGVASLEGMRRFAASGPAAGFGADEPEVVSGPGPWGREADVAARLEEWGLVFVGRRRDAEAPVAVLLDETRDLLRKVWGRA